MYGVTGMAGKAPHDYATGHSLPMTTLAQKQGIPQAIPRPGSGFVVQVLAARDGLECQRLKRCASGGDAVRAYQATGALTMRRMPAGYRTDSDA